jgi:uncharacterized protein YhfF
MLKEAEHEFLQEYFATLDPEDVPEEVTVRAGKAGNAALAEELLELYLTKKKWAASGLAQDYILAGDPLPSVEDYWIVLDTQEVPRCILRTSAVEMHLFKDVPANIAEAEGEGDLSLEYWRKAHRDFFTPYLEGLGIEDLETAQVITEFFELVYLDESGGTSN